MDTDNDDKNIEKLISYYHSITASEKEQFMKGMEYLCECFHLDELHNHKCSKEEITTSESIKQEDSN